MKCYIRENWLYIRNLYYYNPVTVMDCSSDKMEALIYNICSIDKYTVYA